MSAPALPSQPPIERGLLPLALTSPSGLRYGIDPSSLSIGADWVVRYVVVIQGNNVPVQAWFEGLRCASAEVKTYARWSAGTQSWRAVDTPTWRGWDSNQPSRHAYVLARQGACPTGATASAATVEDIVRALRARRLDMVDHTP